MVFILFIVVPVALVSGALGWICGAYINCNSYGSQSEYMFMASMSEGSCYVPPEIDPWEE